MSNWSDPLGLSPIVAQGLIECGYTEAAPVQLTLLPPLLRGENLIGQAKSGSGKTVAYAAGILNDLDLSFEHRGSLLLPTKTPKDPQIAVRQRLQSLVVVPTREIGLQVATEISKIARPMLRKTQGLRKECTGECLRDKSDRISPPPDADLATKTRICLCQTPGPPTLGILACVGGCPITYDLMAMRLRRPQIVVVTPGRLLTLAQDSSSLTTKKARTVHGSVANMISAIRWKLPQIKNLVLDEADRLLSEAFRPQIVSLSKLLADLGGVRILAYSATFPPPVLSFAEKLIYDLTTNNRDDSGKAELRLIVDGVDEEPPETIEKRQILRKCFMVSSFYDQTLKQARAPLRMDLNQQVSDRVIDTPTLNHVICRVLTMAEDAIEEDCISQWAEYLSLGSNSGEEDTASPKSFSQLIDWLDEDFNHWPDLRIKFIGLVMCLWKEVAASKKFVVFCNDLFSGMKVAQFLTELGLSSEYISGKIEQEVRQKQLRRFRGDEEGAEIRGLVCSDLIARGLDIPEVDLVLNIDLPESHDTCLHRIGRCGRFGRSDGKVYFILRQEDELRTLQLFAFQTGLALEFLDRDSKSCGVC